MKIIFFLSQKVKGAQELGAAGVLIYSDPRDDGHVTMDNGYVAYPGGPARNPTSVQRGSVQYLSIYPGDPTTPGYPSYKDAKRTEGANIPAIPSLPISWANARRLLEEIGDIYLEDERGNKRLTGKASQKRVRLVNHGEYDQGSRWGLRLMSRAKLITRLLPSGIQWPLSLGISRMKSLSLAITVMVCIRLSAFKI